MIKVTQEAGSSNSVETAPREDVNNCNCSKSSPRASIPATVNIMMAIVILITGIFIGMGVVTIGSHSSTTNASQQLSLEELDKRYIPMTQIANINSSFNWMGIACSNLNNNIMVIVNELRTLKEEIDQNKNAISNLASRMPKTSKK